MANGKDNPGQIKKDAAKAAVAERMRDKAGAVEAMVEDTDGITARAAFVKAQYDALKALGLPESVISACFSGAIRVL